MTKISLHLKTDRDAFIAWLMAYLGQHLQYEFGDGSILRFSPEILAHEVSPASWTVTIRAEAVFEHGQLIGLFDVPAITFELVRLDERLRVTPTVNPIYGLPYDHHPYLDDLVSAMTRTWPEVCEDGSGRQSDMSLPTQAEEAQPEPAERYIFRRSGEVWEVAYGTGKTFHLPDADGLKYIALLLKQPLRPLGALEMIQLIKGDRSGVGHVPDPEEKEGIGEVDWGDGEAILDDKALEQYRDRLLELQEERKAADQLGDEQTVLKIDEEEEVIEKALRGATGLFGRKRKVHTSLDRARITVRKSIELAKKKIQSQDTRLFEHLDSSIKTGGECTYGPEGELPNWTL